MKKKLSLFLTSLVSTLLLVALLAVPASADTSVSCGENLTFKQDWSIGWSGITYTVTVSGSGPMYDYTEGTAPWYSSNRTKTTSVVIERETSTVGTYAFYNYTGVTSISLPESV